MNWLSNPVLVGAQADSNKPGKGIDVFSKQ